MHNVSAQLAVRYAILAIIPMEGNSHLAEITERGARWVHCRSNTDAALRELKKRFGFHDADLQDARPPLQRPKLVVREGYLFMILLFPYYNSREREIWITEVDCFVGRDFLVTINHHDEYQALAEQFAACQSDAKTRAAALEGGIPSLLFRLLDTLHQATFPMLVHISQDIDDLEENLFDVRARGTISEILRIKSNIVDFRRAMQGHKPVLDKLLAAGNGLLEVRGRTNRWNDLLDTTKEIWAYLETLRDTISALHETHSSLLSHRISEVMKRLTLVSVILLPLTLISSLFGMNYEDIPFASSPHGFWMVIVLLLATFAAVLGYFKSRDWF